jgi:hypothetical protein
MQTAINKEELVLKGEKFNRNSNNDSIFYYDSVSGRSNSEFFLAGKSFLTVGGGGGGGWLL